METNENECEQEDLDLDEDFESSEDLIGEPFEW